MSGILQARSRESTRRPRFIFMLTRDDRTITDARNQVPTIAAAGVGYAGAKDVGLSPSELAGLFADLRAVGCATFLEVVSETPEAMVASARAALEIAPDYLIGGTAIGATKAILEGSGIGYFPYIGRVVGHPCLLRGTIAEIVADGVRAEAAGVEGINLLAYRYDGDVQMLVAELQAAVEIPVLCAGSIDSETRIAAMRRLGVWAFTIGTAVLDGVFVPGRPLMDQLRRVLELSGTAPNDGPAGTPTAVPRAARRAG